MRATAPQSSPALPPRAGSMRRGGLPDACATSSLAQLYHEGRAPDLVAKVEEVGALDVEDEMRKNACAYFSGELPRRLSEVVGVGILSDGVGRRRREQSRERRRKVIV